MFGTFGPKEMYVMAQARIRERLKRIRDHRRNKEKERAKEKQDKIDDITYLNAMKRRLQKEGKIGSGAIITKIKELLGA